MKLISIARMHPNAIQAIIQAAQHRLDTKIMSAENKSKRKYTILSDDDWATIRAEWEGGDTTLADLSDRFGASIRSIQNFFERHGVTKGSARTAATLDAIRLAVPEPSPANAADPQAVKSLALRGLADIEAGIAEQLAIARADPSQSFRCGSAVKMFGAAADALAKSYALKERILGLDRESAQEKTILTVRELFEEDIQRLREDDEDNDDDLPAIDDRDDDVVVEEAA